MEKIIKEILLPLYAAIHLEDMRRLYSEGVLFSPEAVDSGAYTSIQNLISHLDLKDNIADDIAENYRRLTD